MSNNEPALIRTKTLLKKTWHIQIDAVQVD